MFYELKYDVTIYDVTVATMLLSHCYHLQSTIYSHTIFPSSPSGALGKTLKQVYFSNFLIFLFVIFFLKKHK